MATPPYGDDEAVGETHSGATSSPAASRGTLRGSRLMRSCRTRRRRCVRLQAWATTRRHQTRRAAAGTRNAAVLRARRIKAPARPPLRAPSWLRVGAIL